MRARKLSMKAWLIERLEQDIVRDQQLLRELKNRGSGPLPAHLRRAAEERGAMRVVLGGGTSAAHDAFLAQILDPGYTRDEVAEIYAAAIRVEAPVDWPKINAAIIERWNKSTLIYIKQRAWKVPA